MMPDSWHKLAYDYFYIIFTLYITWKFVNFYKLKSKNKIKIKDREV